MRAAAPRRRRAQRRAGRRDRRARSPRCRSPSGAVPWTDGRARRHLEPRRGRDGAARRRRGRGRRARLRLGARDAARRRLVADEDRGRRGRGRPRRGQHVGLPRGRGVAPLAGAPRPRRSCAGCWPAVRAGLDWVVSLQLPFGGHRAGPPVDDFALLAGSSSIYQSLRAGVALAELLDEPQPEWELAGGRLGHARARAPRPVRRQVDLLDGLVLPGARRRRARPRPARAAGDPLGRLRGAGPRHPLRRHQPLGHRRRDLRAGDGPGRRRRPRAGAARCWPTCSTCAPRTAPTGPAGSTATRPTSARSPTSTGPWSTPPTPRPRWSWPSTPWGRPTATPRPARASCAARRWRRRSPELGAGVRLRRVSRPGRPPLLRSRRSTRIDPTTSTSVEGAAGQRPQVDVVRRPAAVGGVGEDVVDDEQRRRAAPTAPSRRSRPGRAPRRARRR